MSQDERSIMTEHVFLCGDHAMEWELARFRTEEFSEFMADVMEGPVMRHELRRRSEITDDLTSCACCWRSKPAALSLATFAVELTIDGDG